MKLTTIQALFIEQLKDLASEAPVIRLVNLLISRAIESRSSDIHIEPFEKDLKVRYRIDGILLLLQPDAWRRAQCAGGISHAAWRTDCDDAAENQERHGQPASGSGFDSAQAMRRAR